MATTYTQDPDEELDYDADFTDYLTARGTTIHGSTLPVWTLASGLSIVQQSNTSYIATVRISIDSGATGTKCATCLMTSADGEKKEYAMKIRIKNSC